MTVNRQNGVALCPRRENGARAMILIHPRNLQVTAISALMSLIDEIDELHDNACDEDRRELTEYRHQIQDEIARQELIRCPR
jgi:hypothetical protein